MYKNDIIEPAENMDYNLLVFLVNKKSGAKRLVMDLRILRGINSILRPKTLVLPCIDELLDEIGAQKSQYLSSADMFSSFYQVRIAKDSRKYTTFTSPLTSSRWNHTRSKMGCLNRPRLSSQFSILCLQVKP